MKFKFLNTLIALGLLIAILVFTYHSPPAHFHDDFEKKSQFIEHQYHSNNLCHDLQKQMQSIDNQRTFLALEQINHDLRLCLPQMSASEQLAMMRLSSEMYQKFIQVNRNEQQERAFHRLATIDNPLLLQIQKEFELLHPRDQYLLQHQGQHLIQVIQTEDGEVFYQRNSDYLLNYFAPYIYPKTFQFKI